MKRTSKDKEPSYVHSFKTQTKQNSLVQVLYYVSCLYDNKWWVGIITNVDKEEEDVQVKLCTHPVQADLSNDHMLMISVGFLMIIFYVKLTFP